MKTIRVKKRNGKLEDWDVEKIHKVIKWAVDGYEGVSVSDIGMHAELNLYDKITTREIHDVLVQSASDLISEEEPNYQWVASRLLSYKLRKDVWGGKEPPRLIDHIKSLVKQGIYDPEILTKYTKDEINKIGNYINHDRDYNFTYAGLQQLIDKYLLKHRITGEVYETPQFAYMLISLCLFQNYGENRLDYVKRAYDHFSTFKINLPTPIMAGVRTKLRQFASCILVDVGDQLDSIFSSVSAVAKYTSQRAGIGINMGRIRPVNSPIRNGEVIHTGVVPFLKVFESTVKSTSQNALRGGGATCNMPWWHFEIEDIVILKNNAGTDDNRVRKLDYVIQLDKVFYERVINNQDITLFSPHECVGLYESFGHPEFQCLYEQYEKDESIKIKKVIPARKLIDVIAKERLETGRIYIMNLDNCNQNGSWNVDCKMTNLCCEIIQHTKPLQSLEDEDAEIGVCILSALNLLEIKNDDELKSSCDIVIRLLEELIDYQEYPVKAAENFCRKRRSLGIGVTNFAAWLAKQKLFYDNEQALSVVDELFEKTQYYMLCTSNELAKEKGACERFADTKYAQGLLPFEWANKNAVGLVNRPLSMDWEALRANIKEWGLRHSTVSTIMPAESCLYWGTLIKTSDGDLNFHQICDRGLLNWEMIEKDNAVGWHELIIPVEVDTRDGYKKVNRIYYNGIPEKMAFIEFYDNEPIKCTAQHKLFSVDYNDWVKPAYINEGDMLVGGTVKSVTWIDGDHTYDLEVDDIHEYLSANLILNHNSSVIQNSTNGIEPIRKIITFKKAKNGTLKQLAPMYPRYKNYYTLAFDIKSNDCINKLAAIMQKWIDMSISLNHYYNYAHYQDGQIPRSVIVRDLITAYKYGIKTLYYANSPDGDSDIAGSCSSGSCAI